MNSIVKIDSYKCESCNKDCRELINIDCMHCYQCLPCFNKEENKFKCLKCGKKINS